MARSASCSPPDSKVHIAVALEDDLVRFRVSDEGAGIPEDERLEVFERFRRLDGGGKKKPGAGLGLYICRGLVEAHGTDRIESATIARLDSAWRHIPGSEETLACDTLCLGYGFIPSNTLSRLMGAKQEWRPELGGEVPLRDNHMRTSVPAVYAVGDGAGIGGGPLAMLEGQIAGIAAAARRAISPATFKLKPHKIGEDVVVPRSKIPELVAFTEALAARHRLIILSFGHAGDGNIHVNLMLDRNDPRELAAAEAATGELFTKVIELGGTITGEHGVGLTKAAFLGQEIDATTLEIMRAIKQTFDPAGLLNPGKIFG